MLSMTHSSFSRAFSPSALDQERKLVQAKNLRMANGQPRRKQLLSPVALDKLSEVRIVGGDTYERPAKTKR